MEFFSCSKAYSCLVFRIACHVKRIESAIFLLIFISVFFFLSDSKTFFFVVFRLCVSRYRRCLSLLSFCTVFSKKRFSNAESHYFSFFFFAGTPQ